MVVAGFLRVVTNHRVFIDPDPVQDAIAFVDALLETPGAEVCPSGHEWPVLRNKLIEGNLEGNLVTDAWIAAVVLHQSESLATFDKDFRQLLPAHALIFLADKDARRIPREREHDRRTNRRDWQCNT